MKLKFFKKKNKAPRKYYLINDKSNFLIKESYRSIRTNLMSILSVYEGSKSVVITSPETTDGKTLTVSNIAISFSQLGNCKVLLIDADMRKPKIQRIFSAKGEMGLSDYLGGFTDTVPIEKTKYDNLDIVTAGTIPPDPTRLILSNNFARFLEYAKANYDYVFFDAPPVNLLTDAVLIAKQTLGCVLVVRYDFTTKEGLATAKNEIESGSAELLGVILNHVDLNSKTYKNKIYTKSTYNYYSYEYKESGDNNA